MHVLRNIVIECRADGVFAAIVAGLGAWSILSLVLLALNIVDLFPRP